MQNKTITLAIIGLVAISFTLWADETKQCTGYTCPVPDPYVANGVSCDERWDKDKGSSGGCAAAKKTCCNDAGEATY